MLEKHSRKLSIYSPMADQTLRVAATVAVYNEAAGVRDLLDALLAQSRPLDQVVIVDDGSSDTTPEILHEYAEREASVLVISQKNQGPAVARNKAWRAAEADLCLFTDGDCVPEVQWAEKLIAPFVDSAANSTIGAVGGSYRTLNTHSTLAKFIGSEIDWRYRNVSGEISAHGTYSLAVRRTILEKIGGFNEAYPKPSGEDFDLTYKISCQHRILFEPAARVGTQHPEHLGQYLKIQARRAYDRIRLYGDHPEQAHSDNYTEATVKYEILSALFLLPLLVLGFFVNELFWLCGVLVTFLIYCRFSLFRYQLGDSFSLALGGAGIAFVRNYAWAVGLIAGVVRLGSSAFSIVSGKNSNQLKLSVD